MADEPTLGEILRRLEELSFEVKSIPLRIDENYLRRDVYQADLSRVEQAMDHIIHRIEQMESRSEWVVRTVGALVITAIVGIAIYLQ
jgi:hypothetical protein